MATKAAFRNMPRRVLIQAVRAYRLFLSPWLGSSCRFEPTCSAYSLQALEQHGALTGTLLTVSRLLRCHPWCAGGHDPVPLQPLRCFTRLLADDLQDSVPPATSLPSSREKNFP